MRQLEEARGNRVYREIIDYCVGLLSDPLKGHFSKADVLDRLGYSLMERSIRWDWIRTIIEDEQATKLIPLAPRYFKRHSRHDEALMPEKYIAGGNGRAAAGFANVIKPNGHLVFSALVKKQKTAGGFANAANKFLEVGRMAGVEQLTDQKELPAPDAGDHV
jgi:hypothetical protein